MKSNRKSYDLVRWIALLPAVCLVWWIASSVCLIIDAWTSSEIFFGLELWGMAICFILFPAIAMFFTAKWIAPKYKNLMGIFAIFICLLWTAFFWYSLGHVAY